MHMHMHVATVAELVRHARAYCMQEWNKQTHLGMKPTKSIIMSVCVSGHYMHVY